MAKSTPQTFRTSVLNVYHDLGGDAALAAWARKHPREFYEMVARIDSTAFLALVGQVLSDDADPGGVHRWPGKCGTRTAAAHSSA